MPNNFKLTGDYYVSKAGNDANNGLTPDTPLLTVQAGLNKLTTSNKTLIIASGVYREQLSISISAITGVRIIGDGTVWFEGNGTNTCFLGSSSAALLYIYNINFRNYYRIFLYQTNTNGYSHSFYNCTFIGQLGYQTGVNSFTVVMFGCKFINNTLPILSEPPGLSNVLYIELLNCILINSIFSNPLNATKLVTKVLNTYIDSSSIVDMVSGVTAINFNFNNIQGKIIMNTNGAVSGVNSNGVALSFAQHRIDYPTYNVNSFSSDPKFNNPRLLDFTLQAGSPNVSASSDYVTNIGGTEYAVPFTASSAAFTTNATSQSLEYRGIYYAISGSAVSGSITSGPMFLQWPRTKPLTSVNWIGALEFNKTITASLAGNNNVPAYTTFTSASGLAGANPDRLKIRLRYSTQQTQPATDAEWDNNGYWPAGTYQLFEINQKPKVDYKGTGNGDPTYVETSAIGDLVPSWIQTEIILRNDYNR